MHFKIESLNIGKISQLDSKKGAVSSGYRKSSVEQCELTATGFIGDRQADLDNHGGVDKAICVFSSHHFPAYCDFLDLEAMPVPAFGENLTVDYLDEEELFIGDIFSCGEVRLQISQPRQPCSKTGLFYGNNKVIKFMSETGRTGFYFRVLQSGLIQAGNTFERQLSEGKFSLKMANDIMYRRQREPGIIQAFIDYPLLSQAWKDELSARRK